RIAIETIRRIEARGLRIPTIDLIAKHSMCLQEAAPSHGRAFQEFCDFRVKSRTCSFFTRDNSAVVAAVLQRTLHVQELVRASSACRVCPHRVAMDAAAHSRLVVCDYNYVFSDIRGRFLPRLGRSLEDLILIVDEAHNLPDRIRAHLVGDLSVLDVLRAAKEARSIDGEVAQELVAVAQFLVRWRDQDEGSLRLVVPGTEGKFAFRLLDPSVLSRAIFDGVHASILMSGTLFPAEMYADLLGISAGRRVLRTYASP